MYLKENVFGGGPDAKIIIDSTGGLKAAESYIYDHIDRLFFYWFVVYRVAICSKRLAEFSQPDCTHHNHLADFRLPAYEQTKSLVNNHSVYRICQYDTVDVSDSDERQTAGGDYRYSCVLTDRDGIYAQIVYNGSLSDWDSAAFLLSGPDGLYVSGADDGYGAVSCVFYDFIYDFV